MDAEDMVANGQKATEELVEFKAPTCYADKIEKKLQRIVRRLNKLGVEAEYTRVNRGEVIQYQAPDTGRVWHIPATNFTFIGHYTASGWTFIGVIDHLENGEVVLRPVHGMEIPEKYRHAEPVCDHCGRHNTRHRTLVVRNDEDGSYKQLGTTCVEAYTGSISANAVAAFWDCMGMVEEAAHPAYDREVFGFMPCSEYIDTHRVIAFAIDSISSRGYRKADTGAESTAWDVRERLGTRGQPTATASSKADEIIEWLKSIEQPENEYMHNLRSLALNGACRDEHVAILASAPLAYDRMQERLEEQRAAENASAGTGGSGYVGEVGERVTVEIASAASRGPFSGDYGDVYLNLYTDKDGNRLKWFTNANNALTDEQIALIEGGFDSVKVTLTATVKKHDEYKGTKQTQVNRGKMKVEVTKKFRQEVNDKLANVDERLFDWFDVAFNEGSTSMTTDEFKALFDEISAIAVELVDGAEVRELAPRLKRVAFAMRERSVEPSICDDAENIAHALEGVA